MFHGFHLPAPFKLSLLDLTTLFFFISHYHLQCLQSAIRHKQPATLLYVYSARCCQSKPDYRFCRWHKVFKEITSTRDAEQLQEDISDLVTWSDSSSLNFNYSKCKAQRITRKVSLKLTLPRRILVFTSLITPRGTIKSMCNALKGQHAPGICTKKHQPRQKHCG